MKVTFNCETFSLKTQNHVYHKNVFRYYLIAGLRVRSITISECVYFLQVSSI